VTVVGQRNCCDKSSGNVRLDRSGGVAAISFGSATSKYLTLSMVEELESALSAAERHASVVLITGSGRVFSLGADLAAMESMSQRALDQYLAAGQRLMKAVEGSRVPTIAAVNGAALGGGFELALSCDMRWCHPSSFFQLPESSLGLLPAWGAARLLRSSVSPGAAMELLCGQRIGALTAQTLGLVSRIIPGRDFAAEAVASAATLAQLPRVALETVKVLWVHAEDGGSSSLERTLFTGLHRQRQKNNDSIATPDNS
jgi:enoyl-CoA hydratase/carnithine racemase